jgi:hypothetical protein
MPHDECAMALSHENPYAAPNVVRRWHPPEPAVVTMRDLDRLVAARLDDARVEAAERERQACAAAWEEGRHAGFQAGSNSANEFMLERIERVVRGRLNHIARRLEQRGDQPKSTIAHEREVMRRDADELRVAIRELQEGHGA